MSSTNTFKRTPSESPEKQRKGIFPISLRTQVLLAVAAGIVLGILRPSTAVAMQPLGNAFIKLISMIITVVIFCTVVIGIAGMGDIKKVGRVGGKALLYFEVVSTLALLFGLAVGNAVQTGSGLNVNPATLDMKAVATYAGQAKSQSMVDFLMHVIPNTFVDAFSRGDILGVVLVSVLFGLALSRIGNHGKHLIDLIEDLRHVVFGVVDIMMKFAPLGAFGAIAFTVGRYGLSSLGPLAKLIITFWITSTLFVLVILGAICWAAGFSIIRYLYYIREEIELVLSLSSSEPALPMLMEKVERLGCSKALVGLVVPTGYMFNTDGTGLYMTLAALFVAQATNIHLTFGQ